jgi:hypothetical protein
MTRDIKESEQSKEAEIVRLPTPARTIWIDWSTGQLCVPEPIEHGGRVIPFTAPRGGLRGKRKITGTTPPCPQLLANSCVALWCDLVAIVAGVTFIGDNLGRSSGVT